MPVTTPLPAADGEVGASRFFELLTAQPSPKALPAPLYVDGSVDVAVQNEPAMRARVDADVQSLRDLLAASAAFLRRATRVHPKELAPGTFGLGSEDRGELSPRGVVHLLGEAHARQALGVEVFHCDRIEALDDAERGFSFQQEGPLDMRMDRRQPLTAADLVNTASAEELATMFWELGGERDSRRLARAIQREREQRRFATTRQLAGLIESVAPRHGRKAHPATKVFQALRMAVNDEMGSLKTGLAGVLRILKPGGRLVVITFQSVDDRIVKDFGRAGARDYTFTGVDVPELRKPRAPELKWVQRKALKPGAVEIADNPRSRSAQLRVMERVEVTWVAGVTSVECVDSLA